MKARPTALRLLALLGAFLAMPAPARAWGLSCEEIYRQAFDDYRNSPEILQLVRWNDNIEKNMDAWETVAQGLNERYLATIDEKERGLSPTIRALVPGRSITTTFRPTTSTTRMTGCAVMR